MKYNDKEFANIFKSCWPELSLADTEPEINLEADADFQTGIISYKST